MCSKRRHICNGSALLFTNTCVNPQYKNELNYQNSFGKGLFTIHVNTWHNYQKDKTKSLDFNKAYLSI